MVSQCNVEGLVSRGLNLPNPIPPTIVFAPTIAKDAEPLPTCPSLIYLFINFIIIIIIIIIFFFLGGCIGVGNKVNLL